MTSHLLLLKLNECEKAPLGVTCVAFESASRDQNCGLLAGESRRDYHEEFQRTQGEAARGYTEVQRQLAEQARDV